MRAVACAIVVAFHVDPEALPNGWLGVDIFFVISGFVVTQAFRRAARLASSSSSHAASFYARRVRRLMPSTALVVLVTLLAISLAVPIDEEAISGREDGPDQVVSNEEALRGIYWTGLSSAVGWANNYLAQRSAGGQAGGGYWGEGKGSTHWNPFTHFWSLGVEEQFYALYPPVFYAIAALGRRAGGRAAVAAAVGVAMLSAVLCLVLQLRPIGVSQPDLAFYLMPCRAWQLLLGCALGVRCNRHQLPRRAAGEGDGGASMRQSQSRTVVRISAAKAPLGPEPEQLDPATMRESHGAVAQLVLLEALSVACLVYSLATPNFTLASRWVGTLFPFPTALFPCVGTAAFILAGNATPLSVPIPFLRRLRVPIPFLRRLRVPLPLTNALLATRPCVYLGGLSYAVYLWHWPVIVIARWTFGFHCTPLRAACVGVTMLLSLASHHLVERPVIRHGARPRSIPARALAATPAGTAERGAAGASMKKWWRPRQLGATLTAASLLGTLMVCGLAALLLGPWFGALAQTWHVAASSDSSVSGEAFLACSCTSEHVQRAARASSGLYGADHADPCYSRAAFRAMKRVLPAADRSTSATLHLLGDSHLGNYFRGLQAALIGRFRVRIAWIWDTDAFRPNLQTGDEEHDLAVARAYLRDTIEPALRPGDAVLLASWLHENTRGFWIASEPQLSDERKRRTHTTQLALLAAAVRRHNATLYLAADVPLLLSDGAHCATTLSASFTAWCPAPCARPYGESVGELATAVRVLSAFADATPGVTFFNAHDFMCDGRSCGPFIPGTSTPGYVDNNHLTGEAAFSLWPFLRCHVFAGA